MNRIDVRPESEVFADLTALCARPGYIHAFAHLCWRDNLVRFQGKMTPDDMAQLFRPERLIRTELSTLLGLMVRSRWNIDHPGAEVVRGYIERSDALLRELHHSMPGSMAQVMRAETGLPDMAALGRGAALREPIFYGGESAYIFQYRDFSVEKYAADDDWLLSQMGFQIADAHAVALAMARMQDEKATQAWSEYGRGVDWLAVDLLASFRFTPGEIAARSGLALERVHAVLASLTMTGDNPTFTALSEFNAIYAQPLLPQSNGSVLQFMPYGTAEALYESPFYWMMRDRSYSATAAKHRGDFTENFTFKRLAKVFGSNRVYRGVELHRKKGERAGEIDTLVVYGDRLIVVQTKSKRLTHEARKGNDQQLQGDFAKAIQDAYDQGQSCAELILQGGCELTLADGHALALQSTPKEVFLFTVVADHYPALAFQAGQFLRTRKCVGVRAPFVMDVFLLDALTEMLETPLRLLTYAALRARHAGQLAINHELTALGYHLKLNLWLEDDLHFAMLHDDLATDLDLAMAVRRDGVPGPRTPPGILTRFADSLFGNLLEQLEDKADEGLVDLGLLLMTLGEDTCRVVDEHLQRIVQQTRRDGRRHDFTIGVGSAAEGVTFHCNANPGEEARGALLDYCRRRKYVQKANRWFGLSLDPEGKVQFGLVLECPWEASADMDEQTATMRRRSNVALTRPPRVLPVRTEPKIGPNDPCPCGSGKKYKRCCRP